MPHAIKQEEIQDVLKGIVIPSPPQVIADLQMEIAMPDPDINEMAQLISNDAGLSGSALKIVNSPFYGGNDSVTSIKKAVIMLGVDTIIDIVNTICLKNAITGDHPMSDNLYATLTRFWDSATDVARVCVMVGKRMNLSPLDQVYSLGLFHNVGIGLLVSKHDNYLHIMRSSYQDEGDRIIDVENAEYGTNHAVLGYYTARTWKVSQFLCDIIAQHHNQDLFSTNNLTENREIRILAVLKIAEHIVGMHRILGDTDVDREWDAIGDNVLLAAGLTEYELEDITLQATELGYGQQQYFS